MEIYKYEIEVEITKNQEIVTFWGDIPFNHIKKISEAYGELGFDTVLIGDQNSTMRLLKNKMTK